MKLLEQVRDVIRKKHYSILTEQAYVEWIRRFILFHKKQHPKDMGEKEISQFISHLATDRNVAAGHEPGTDLDISQYSRSGCLVSMRGNASLE
jgi:D-alanyl-D-alanine dipeptidase